MNWKLIIGGGLAMYVAQFVVSFATGPIIHNGILESAYMATASFWRPELTQDPPDMAALMPLWIATGVIGALILAAIYGAVRGAFAGAAWLRGAKYGLTVWLIQAVTMAGWSGVFNLPYKIWGWWAAEGVVYMVIGGIVLGIVANRLAPDGD